MPRIKTIERYQVVDDGGDLYWEFSDKEEAEDYLTELLEGLSQIEEDEKRNSND